MTLTHPPKHRQRVPAEHRVLGLDRRSMPPALFVIVVFVLLTIVVPRINSALDWDDPAQAGDKLALTDTLYFTPVAGWDVETGFRVIPGDSDQKAGDISLTGDGVTFQISPDTFDGTPAELLDQTAKVTSRTSDPSFRVEGDPTSLTTATGKPASSSPTAAFTVTAWRQPSSSTAQA